MLKAFLKRMVGHLTENGKEDRVGPFKQGATEMIKFIMGKFDEMQIFCGEDNPNKPTLILCELFYI